MPLRHSLLAASFLAIVPIIPAISFAEATEAEQALLIQEYEAASRSGDPGRIKAAWENIRNEYSIDGEAAQFVDDHASLEAADHFHQRTGIEKLNAEHRRQAERGEIVPFEDIRGDQFNERVEAAKDPNARKKVTGEHSDRFLADLAEPETPHTDGRAPKLDKGLAELVKEAEVKKADPEAQRQIQEERARIAEDHDRIEQERDAEYKRIDAEETRALRRRLLEASKENMSFEESLEKKAELDKEKDQKVEERFKEADKELTAKREKMKQREVYRETGGETTGVHEAAPADTQMKGPSEGGAANRLSGEEEEKLLAGDEPVAPDAKDQKLLPAGEERKMLPTGEERKLLPVSTEPESAGAKVLDEVSADSITPEDGSQKLQQLETTPEAALRETRGYGDAGPKKTSAPETVAETETRVEFSDSDRPAASSKVMQTVDSVTDAADWGGWAAEAVHTEEVNAAKENREFSKWNVAVNAAKGLAAGQSFETFKKHGEAAKEQAESTGSSKWLAGLAAWGAASSEFARNALTGLYNRHIEYQKEEMEKEIARAQSVGGKADPWRAKIPALMRILGDALPVNKFTEMLGDDSLEALREEAQTRIKVEARTKAAAEVGLAGFGALERELREELLKANGEITDEVLALQKKYHERMAALQDLRDELKAKGLIKEGDPEWTAINQSIDLLDPDVLETLKKELGPEIEDQAHVAVLREGIANCRVTPVEDRLQKIQNPETKAALGAEIQTLKAKVDAVNEKLNQGSELYNAGKLEDARALLGQAIAESPCESHKANLGKYLIDLNQIIASQEKVEACKAVAFAQASVNPATGAVSCVCPEDYKYDAPLKMCVIDRERLDRRLDEINNRSASYDPGPAGVDPGPYLPDVPTYEEEQQEFARQNQMFNVLQARQQASAGNSGGLNVDQMYANLAAGGTQWSDPTNNASGSAFLPSGYTPRPSSGQAAGFSTYGATPAAPQTTYTGGPGQGEFSTGSGSNRDWCTTGRDADGYCNPVRL